METKDNTRRNSMLLGLIIVMFGVFTLGTIFNWYDTNLALTKFWPALLMFVGLIVMSTPSEQMLGFGILIFGFFLQLHTLGFFDTSLGQDIEPLIFILFGLIALVTLASPKNKN